MALNRISQFFNESKHLLAGKQPQRKSGDLLQLCCLSILPQELLLVYADKRSGKPNITLCEMRPYTNNTDLFSVLGELVKNNGLKNVRCSLMLQPKEYQVLITDALPVTPAEFQAAIRWKIKDLIRLPIKDVVIDSFAIPKTQSAIQNKIMVVAAEASRLKITSDQIRKCGLDLEIIDIPELGLRNIMNLLKSDKQSIALVYAQETTIQLLIISEKQLFVSRNLLFSLNTHDSNAFTLAIERLTAEIQRSFEYYHNQWGREVPQQVYLAAKKALTAAELNSISDNLTIPVVAIDLNEYITFNKKISTEELGKMLPVIGGALRDEKDAK